MNSDDEKIYSTIIIGGGVGGLTAARFLKDGLVLEQRKNIGEGPIRTGEGLSHRALVRQNIDPDPRWISNRLKAIYRVSPNGQVFGTTKKEPYAYIIDRQAFEKFLASQSKADIKLGTSVVDLEFSEDTWNVRTADDHVYKSRFVIGADGVDSIVRKRVFNERIKTLPALQYLVQLDGSIETQFAKLYLDNITYPRGYAWFFPKSENTANIGICCEQATQAKLDRFLELQIRPRYGKFHFLENRSGVLADKGPCKTLFKKNALLIGDAAGLSDPIFKGGMSQAMLSGKIAAECILGNEPETYESKIRSLPLADPRLQNASKFFYSFDNETINELAEVLKNRSSVSFLSLKTFLRDVLLGSKQHLKKNLLKITYFLYVWRKSGDYLW